MFGSCGFALKQFSPIYFVATFLPTSLRESKLKAACVGNLLRINRSPLLWVTAGIGRKCSRSIESFTRAFEKKLYPRICGRGESRHVEVAARNQQNQSQRLRESFHLCRLKQLPFEFFMAAVWVIELHK
jgi:hypothetical protein